MIGESPVTYPLLEGDTIGKVWRSWFTEVGDGLSGEWNYGTGQTGVAGNSGWTFTTAGITTSVTPTVTFQERGRVVDLQIEWDGAVTFSSATLTLPSVGFSLKPGVLAFYETDSTGKTATDQNGAYVADDTITIPDLTSSVGAIIVGTVFKEVQ